MLELKRLAIPQHSRRRNRCVRCGRCARFQLLKQWQTAIVRIPNGKLRFFGHSDTEFGPKVTYLRIRRSDIEETCTRRIQNLSACKSLNGFLSDAPLLPYAKASATLRERYWRSLWFRARIIGRFTSDYGVLKRLGDNSMRIGNLSERGRLAVVWESCG